MYVTAQAAARTPHVATGVTHSREWCRDGWAAEHHRPVIFPSLVRCSCDAFQESNDEMAHPRFGAKVQFGPRDRFRGARGRYDVVGVNRRTRGISPVFSFRHVGQRGYSKSGIGRTVPFSHVFLSVAQALN